MANSYHLLSRIKNWIFLFVLILGTLPYLAFASGPSADDVNFSLDRLTRQSQPAIQASEFDGSFHYEVPLTLPPGRNSLEPDLALSYSSGNKSIISPFGYGWSVNIPYIERVNRKGVNKLYTENIFYSSYDGEVIASSTSPGTEDYGPLVENGDFRKYEYVSNQWWRVTDKKGVVYTFGSASTTQLMNTASTTQVYRWMLEEVRDQNDNYIEYTYYKDGNAIYPSTITYTGNGSTDGPFGVEFFRELRGDVATSSASGFPILSRYRMSEIQAKISGSWVRKYTLGYTTGDNGYRGMLSSITESGRDENGNTTTLPTVTFEYSSSTPDWTANASWGVPHDTIIDRIDSGGRFANFNGDGLPDVARGAGVTAWSSPNGLYHNNGDGSWSTTTPSGIPSFVDNLYNDTGWRVADVNGDGLSDFVISSGSTYINHNQGGYFAADANWTAPVDLSDTICCRVGTSNNYSIDIGSRIADLNGDGLPDMIQSFMSDGMATSSDVYLNNGNGWDATSTHAWILPHDSAFAWDNDISTNVYYDYGLRTGDINGDGLTDLFLGHHTNAAHTNLQNRIYFNNGDGTWATSSVSGIAGGAAFASFYGVDTGLRLVDVNGDGLDDVISATQGGTVYINTDGNGTFAEDVSWSGSPVDFNCTAGASQCGIGDIGSRLVDINSDGIIDIVKAEDPSNFDNSDTTTDGVYLGNGAVPDLLKKITLNTGGVITVGYKPSTEYDDSGGNFINPSLPFALQTAETVTTNDGFGVVGTTTNAYGGGEYYYEEPFIRKFAGFATTTATDPLGNVTTAYFHTGTTTVSSLGEYSDHVSKIGKRYREEAYDDSSNLYKTTITRWENVSLSNDRDYVKATTTLELLYDGDADHRDTAVVHAYDDSNGNVATTTEYGEVSGNSNGSFTDTGSDTRTTAHLYAASTTPHIIGLPSKKTTKNHNGEIVAESRFYYDGLSLGEVNKGNLTKQEDWVESSTYIDIERTYDGTYGLVTQEKDPRDKITTFVYDSRNTHVATSTNAESHVTEFIYDYSSGKPATTTDPNGYVFVTVFDGLDRPIAEKAPDPDSPASLIIKKTIQYVDTAGLRSILETLHLNYAPINLSQNFAVLYDNLSGIVSSFLEKTARSALAILFGAPQIAHAQVLSSGHPIEDSLAGKSVAEKAEVKSWEIARRIVSGVYESTQYGVRVEIIGNATPIERNGWHGIQVFARAWRDGKQLGLGSDGTTDIERFLIYNPPVLIDDPNGPIVREAVDVITGEVRQRKLREDPVGALRQVIAHTVTVVGSENTGIVKGKIGNTTSTFYPSAGAVTPVDGAVGNDVESGTWTTNRGAASGTTIRTGTTAEVGFIRNYTDQIWRTWFRGVWLFDTSTIGSDTVSSATFSLYGQGSSWSNAGTGFVNEIALVSSNPASTASLANGDYSSFGTTQLASNIAISAWSTAGYNDFALNASGISTIATGGITKLGTRQENDRANSEPTVDATDRLSGAQAYTADQTGSTQDPKLVVVHSGGAPSSTSALLYKYLDGMDRVIQERSSMEDSDTFAVTDIVYDKRGDISKKTLPYKGTTSSKTSITTNTDLIATYTYDTLRRIKTAVNAAGTESYSYDQWAATTTDRESNTKASIRDAFNNLAGINEHNAGSIYVTRYEYDALDSLTKITDALGNVRNFTYDGLKRLTKSEDIHDGSDTTFATTTYAYDASGNITTKRDQKNQTTNFTYDNIDRVLTEDYTGAAGTEISYGYDWCSNGIGRLCSATTTDAVTKYEYNAHGLKSKETQELGSSSYSTLFSYDWHGNQTKVTYPDTSETSYTYNGAGLLEQILYKEVGTTTQTTIVSDYDYHPSGQILYSRFGNNTQTNFTYSTTTEYRVETIRTSTTTSMMGGSSFAAHVLEKVVTFALTIIFGTPTEAHAQEETGASTTPIIAEAETVVESTEGIVIAEEVAHNASATTPEHTPIETVIEDETASTTGQTLDALLENTTSTTQDSVIVDNRVSTTTPQEILEGIFPETSAGDASGGEVVVNEAPAVPTLSIRNLIQGKSVEEKAEIKSREIATHNAEGMYNSAEYGVRIEIVGDITSIQINGKSGIQVFAKAWRNGKQLGFGSDGTTDVERFLIYNPPLLVDDPNGDIVQDYIEEDPVMHRQVPKQRRLREDVVEAVRQVIAHNASLVGREDTQIIQGKIGNTTSTFYPAAGANEPVDGTTFRDVESGTWSSNRGASDGTVLRLGTTGEVSFLRNFEDQIWRGFARAAYLFDTSTIGTDEITSATFSVYGAGSSWTNAGTGFVNEIALVSSNPASTAALVNGDYDVYGTTKYANNLTISGWNTAAYNNWTLNATGEGAIAKTGITKLGTRGENDRADSEPTVDATDRMSGATGYFADETGTTKDPKLVVVHGAGNSAPIAPTSLQTESQTNPTNITDSTPEFSAIYNDADASDYALAYQVQVATSSDYWGAPYWDSGMSTSTASTTVSNRTEQIAYAGTTLASSTTYYWRIRLRDNSFAIGDWSTTTASFSLAATIEQPGVGYQNITYTYDSVGNITAITDYSLTNAYRVLSFTYDDLNRLLTASTTLATTTPFRQTYGYSSIGNITEWKTNSSATSTYTYAETNYTNPHAVTTIGATSYAYDDVGNLTTTGAWNYDWDYRNRLTQAESGTATTTYAYTHENIRVVKGSGTATTTYANRYYTVTSPSAGSGQATTTKHILGPKGETIATIEGNGSATSTYFNHADHLGGTNVVTDENGDLAQTLDYYPFGAQRINTKAGNFDEQYKFTGHEQDEDTDLTYAKQRYYGQDYGRFLSVDPVAERIAKPDELLETTGWSQENLLKHPQLLNTYSYTANNPLIYTDPEGEALDPITISVVGSLIVAYGLADIAMEAHADAYDRNLNGGLNLGDGH